MKIRNFVLVLMALSLVLLIPAAWLRAEEEPASGVARISLIHGDVSTMRGDTGDWGATTLNAPLVRGDKISTGPRSRTEIELDSANILRLDQRTQVKLADLTRTRVQVQVSEGTINFTVFRGTEADVEIDTPNVSVHPLGEGVYRVQVNSPSETEVIVREGEAEVSTPQGSVTVEKKHLMTIQGTDSPEYQIAKAPGRDEWDQWNRERDGIIEDAQSWQHTNRYYTGTHDLDRYGHWESRPGYGDVWAPDEGPDWTPYRDGRWVWEPYYGWTWVSYEPWGWAPYHYGRWFWDDSWLWWPGPIYPAYYPVWAPAYVSFFGFGRHFGFGFGFGFGSIGWLPVGPCDFFFPWWGFGSRFNVVNITNVTNITNINNINNVTNATNVMPPLATGQQHVFSNVKGVLNNTHLQRAITTMPAANFGKAAVPQHPTPVTSAMLHEGHMVAGTVPVVPTRQSLRPVDRAANPAAVPAGANRPGHFFTKGQPPAGPRPFTEQAAQVQQMVQQHRPPAPANLGSQAVRSSANPERAASPRPNVPTTSGAQTGSTPARAEAPTSGWRQFGGGNPQAPAPTMRREGASNAAAARPQETVRQQSRPVPQATPDRSGWQRFSAAPRAEGSARSSPATREASAPQAFAGRRAPSAPGEQAGGWQRFTSREPASPREPAEPGARSSAPRQETAQPGWNRFTPRAEGAPLRHTNNRPPLEVQRPIVVERSRGNEGGGNGGWSAPSGGGRSAPAPRNFGGGAGNGGWSAPSGGGRSAPAPGSFGGSSGNRGWSAPSGGGRSAPAPRSFGGSGGGSHGGGGGGGWGGGGHSSAPASSSTGHKH